MDDNSPAIYNDEKYTKDTFKSASKNPPKVFLPMLKMEDPTEF